MRKTITLVTLLLLVMAVSACGTNDENDASPTAAPMDEPTEAPPPTESYPGPDVPNESYPGPEATEAYPAPQPTPEAGYPDDQAWVVTPAGEQCEALQYETVAEARAALEEGGVEVFDVEEEGRVVCEACGCPTSLHYRARIAIDDLSQAQSLGWQRE